ncbi:ATP-binding domain-containing protein [Rheinheimera sp. F8]|uniref:ATP-binding domain-containing protein n=1 Tax=Rheinheimera sp. F8 TaxID=1763998 RepID=UPI000744B67C|nr:ATP-binding domain-containing protein [Rheinheimera sp. F8]ALZ75688.1 hypothetical protein ATY27_07890 [Rheinheimera sp. F8]
MTEMDFTLLAEESLTTLTEIADTANAKLITQRVHTDSFAAGNTLTGGNAFRNLSSIQQSQHEALQTLATEPAIVRLVLEDDEDKQRVIYIARNSNLSLPSKTEFASYRSPLGRLAEIFPGDESTVTVDGQQKKFVVIEKITYRPKHDTRGWDSDHTIYRHWDKSPYTIDSLRALLISEGLDNADELDLLLEQFDAKSGVVAGIRHQIRTAMNLRDQPILDQFQGEIFRLPLDSQLIILGPPGTGKTTTLIKRLGQKLDFEYLESDERHIAESGSRLRPHASNWLMFTPSELLKHYLKEAFSREQVPASDSHIRTWGSFRNDIARNTLSILRSANSGRFTLKPDMVSVSNAVIEDSTTWFEAFSQFHEQRLSQQLVDGRDIVAAAASESEQQLLQLLDGVTSSIDRQSLVSIYRFLNEKESTLKQALADSKTVADELIKKERSRLYNRDKLVFERLANYLEGLQQEDEPDDEEAFDDDEPEISIAQSQSALQIGVKAYITAIKALARTRYLKRSLSKGSRSNAVVQFLGELLPPKEVLVEIGRHISLQNGLRRFVSSHKHYVTDIPSSYQSFRKDKVIADDFYIEAQYNREHLSNIELDAIILLTLKNARKVLMQSYASKAIEEPRFGYLMNIAELFRTQVMVDEATDFSMLELACMANLTSLESRSFFACGDFNQRITSTGIRRQEQLRWALPSITVKPVQTIYRQSRKLNAFAESLLRLQGGDLCTLGQIPDESTHDGVSPVLKEFAGQENGVQWMAERIKEVERSVRLLPTIAVLVNAEHEVKPMAEKLSQYLEEVNLSAVACEEGKALGEGTDVRVFDIKHIKGLEFEAVFFAGVDNLARDKPDLFDRYLYVGATRAATYLGLVCHGELPEKLQPLKDCFDSTW